VAQSHSVHAASIYRNESSPSSFELSECLVWVKLHQAQEVIQVVCKHQLLSVKGLGTSQKQFFFSALISCALEQRTT